MDEWITTAEAVTLSGYNAEYIRRLIRTDKLKARKFSTVWQISKQSFDEYIKNSEQSNDGRRGSK